MVISLTFLFYSALLCLLLLRIQNDVSLSIPNNKPDLIICRCKLPCTEGTKNKISTFCNVHPNQVISVHDVGSIYRVPIILHEQKVTKFIRERLQLPKVLL